MNQQKQIALGYSDGDIGADSIDAFTSKLGGRPQWLDETAPIPAQSLAVCSQCSSAMVLLTQTYAPLDSSPYDRVLYIWACSRRACAGKPGAATVIRAHLLNIDYAKQLVKQNQKTVHKKPISLFGSGQFGSASGDSKVPDFGSVWRTNSDQVSGAQGSNSLFSGPLFGKQQKPKEQQETALAVEVLSVDLERASISNDTLRIEWDSDVESAPAQYLVFETEELASDKHIREKYKAQIEEALEMAAESTKCKGKSRSRQVDHSNGDGMEWNEERYERTTLPQGIDSAFAQFAQIVGQNPEQVMRYQFGGIPLLYTRQDEIAKMLSNDVFSESIHSYDDDDDDDDVSAYWGRYSTDKLAACPHCGGRRVFECQLMPALLSTLSLPAHLELSATASKPASQLVGQELMQALDLGLEFGTLLVFVCENDCHGGNTGTAYLGNSVDSAKEYSKAAYYQELVLVQLEAN
ncbi:hypothetical protein IWW36_005582 [Coemansia brasiliensis]|uniref:Programmed cell death protein 2 C-terminal domain-containing protein n=1 Tax=Coemansia brasiliensis TaxID=2650707 RepID=A0A9W8LXZ5_9FUNG|nr:hypothetical protein IWW36_005582 [Coemansia brasiliensis]